jgi:O-methyltransferase involved in polyketide biosynthesis
MELTDPQSSRSAGSPRNAGNLLQLTKEQETLVIPLYAKALDYRSKHPILDDRMSDEIVRQIDYDFEKRTSPAGRLLAVRARQLDEWVREFLNRNPNSIVLNLGCGLDTRISRIAPPSSVRWFDVDFPAVIELRHRFYTDRAGYRMVPSSLTRPEWLEGIPRDGPLIAIADGVLPYLARDDVSTLLGRLVDGFPHGQIVFDVLSTSAVRRGKSKLSAGGDAVLKWGVDDLREVDALNPGLKRTATVPLLSSKYAPVGVRLFSGVTLLFPSLRKKMRMVRYEF